VITTTASVDFNLRLPYHSTSIATIHRNVWLELLFVAKSPFERTPFDTSYKYVTSAPIQFIVKSAGVAFVIPLFVMICISALLLTRRYVCALKATIWRISLVGFSALLTRKYLDVCHKISLRCSRIN
jgi:hypothetical protein